MTKRCYEIFSTLEKTRETTQRVRHAMDKTISSNLEIPSAVKFWEIREIEILFSSLEWHYWFEGSRSIFYPEDSR
jgi:hypothetical protein